MAGNGAEHGPAPESPPKPSVLIEFEGVGLAHMTIYPSVGLQAAQLYAAAFFLDRYAAAYAAGMIAAGMVAPAGLTLPPGNTIPFRPR